MSVTNPKKVLIRRKIRVFSGLLLMAWAMAAFGWVWFARDLNFKIGGWTFNFWMGAQGSLLFFLLLTVLNARYINRWEKELSDEETQPPPSAD
jgi:putative solute:sodium symporter small subunit